MMNRFTWSTLLVFAVLILRVLKKTIVNPAFGIFEWGNSEIELNIDEQKLAKGIRKGSVKTTDKSTLIFFVELSTENIVNINTNKF